MKKKQVLILASLCIVIIALIICLTFIIDRTEEISGDRMEELRDQLKVYDDEIDGPDPDTENDDPPESEPESDTLDQESGELDEDGSETNRDEPDESESESDSVEVDSETESDPSKSESTTPQPSVNPDQYLNFTQMQKINPDIYAWVEIEGTKVDYPILQSPYDDNRYLTAAHDGSPYIGGSIFTQATYNSTDFDDPVTIMYGHTMTSGILFGQLQTIYTNSKTFKEHSEIKIYLPGQLRRYKVFAAVPYEKTHILHVYDFNNTYWYNNFFNNVKKIRGFNTCFDFSSFPEAGDRVIILSTCLNEDCTQRFLVMAILQDDLD